MPSEVDTVDSAGVGMSSSMGQSRPQSRVTALDGPPSPPSTQSFSSKNGIISEHAIEEYADPENGDDESNNANEPVAISQSMNNNAESPVAGPSQGHIGRHKRVASTSEPRESVNSSQDLSIRGKRSRLTPRLSPVPLSPVSPDSFGLHGEGHSSPPPETPGAGATSSAVDVLERSLTSEPALAEPDLAGRAPTRPPFNLFRALLKQNDLLLQVTTYLPVPDIITFYSISKHFYYLVNTHCTTYMVRIARIWSPRAEEIFPFAMYKDLCIIDPIRRPKSSDPDTDRMVPSFKWLQMVIYRQVVVDEIILRLAAESLFLAPNIDRTIKKIWFMMDIPTSGVRIAIIRSTKYWTNTDIFLAILFMIKLDMRFTDPLDGRGELALRRLLLGQRTLTPLWQVLSRNMLTTSYLELMQMHLRYSWRPEVQMNFPQSILGVPHNEVGKLCMEGWGLVNRRLIRPDELIFKESIRRQLATHNYWIDCILYGFVDPHTLEEPTLPLAEETLERKREAEGLMPVAVVSGGQAFGALRSTNPTDRP